MSDFSPSELLRAKLEFARPTLVSRSRKVWQSDRVRELYPEWLVLMHGVVRTALPLMRAALAQAQALAEQDAVAEAMIPFLEQHIPEETGHDRWLLEDLAATGRDPDQVLRLIPSPKVANMADSQYYWVYHHHPISLFGHMAAIEGDPPSLGFADFLREVTGYPPEAFRSIRRHSELDLHHARDLFDAIDSMPLEPGHEAMMGLSALHTIESLTDLFGELYTSSSTRSSLRSA